MSKITKAYQWLIYLGGYLKSPILLFCRLYWGFLFMQAGWTKVNDIAAFIGELSTHGFPAPELMGWLAALTELIGGFCLLIGFASRLAAIPLAITMLVAYASVHSAALTAFFSEPKQFVQEAPFNFLLTALLVFAFGPGRFSLDYFLEKLLFSRAEAIPKHQHEPK